jgi:hypothetical protein
LLRDLAIQHLDRPPDATAAIILDDRPCRPAPRSGSSGESLPDLFVTWFVA